MKAVYACGPRVPMAARAMLVSALLCILAGPACAQQAAQNAYTDLSQYLVNGNQIVPQQTSAATAPGGLSSSVSQTGLNNVASVTLSGNGNVTNQYQSGSQNSSTLAVRGAQNSVSTSQIGSTNTTSIGVVGNGNSISNLQVGSGLSYQLQVIGTSAPVSVQQYGRK